MVNTPANKIQPVNRYQELYSDSVQVQQNVGISYFQTYTPKRYGHPHTYIYAYVLYNFAMF